MTIKQPKRRYSQLNSPTKFNPVFGHHLAQEIFFFLKKCVSTILYQYLKKKKTNTTHNIIVVKSCMDSSCLRIPDMGLLSLCSLGMGSLQLFPTVPKVTVGHSTGKRAMSHQKRNSIHVP